MITPTVSAGQASSRPSSGKSDSSKSPATSSDEGDSEYISYSDGSSEGTCTCTLLGEQGLHSGESARLPPLWPRFNSRYWRHMWIEFVVGSRSCSKGFSPGSPVVLHPQKPTRQIPIPPGNIYQNMGSRNQHLSTSMNLPQAVTRWKDEMLTKYIEGFPVKWAY